MTTPVLILGSLQAHAVCVDVIRGGVLPVHRDNRFRPPKSHRSV